MADDTIQTIIAVEKEIQARIAREEEQIALWLASQRQALHRRLAQGEEELQQRLLQSEERSRQEAILLSTQIITAAERERDWLHGISQDTIDAMLKRHLRKILPG